MRHALVQSHPLSGLLPRCVADPSEYRSVVPPNYSPKPITAPPGRVVPYRLNPKSLDPTNPTAFAFENPPSHLCIFVCFWFGAAIAFARISLCRHSVSLSVVCGVCAADGNASRLQFAFAVIRCRRSHLCLTTVRHRRFAAALKVVCSPVKPPLRNSRVSHA